MYSFYGGKQGESFVIVKSFASVDEMITEFKKGYDYTEVGFDEYVLINTADKTDSSNGALYRRGYEFNETIEVIDPETQEVSYKETGGAIYIGTIVGPAGSASKLGLKSYDALLTEAGDFDQEFEELNSLKTKGEFDLNEGLVPGSYIENGERKWNDKISWVSVCIRDSNQTDAKTYVGFKIPYTVFDFTAETVDSTEPASIIRDEESNGHPFFEKWKINVPRGFRGDSFENFRVITANMDDGVEEYEGQNEDREKGNQICVCDFVIDDGTQDGIRTTIYVGDYNVLKDISMSSEGLITVEGTHSEPFVINTENAIKYITNVEVDKETQKVKITYNIPNEKGEIPSYDIGEPLNAIQEMVINPNNYHLLVYYNSSIVRNQLQNSVAYPEVGENRKEGWLDLGSIKDESGILVGLNIPLVIEGENKNDTIPEAIACLNRDYPSGLDGTNLKGKIVTIGNSEDMKNFYAYDYNRNTWYYLGTFDNNIEKIIIDGTEESALNNLSEGGVWLKVTEIEV